MPKQAAPPQPRPGRSRTSSRVARWILSIADDPEPRSGSEQTVRAFRRFLLMHGCARSWLWVAVAEDLWLPGLVASALVMSLAFAALWSARTDWAAPLVALPALVAQLALTLPLTDNHFTLELYAVALLCLVGRRADGSELALASLRWLCVIVLFHTGLQKVMYGQYFDGQFLAFMVAQGERFATAFAPLVSDTQLELLRSYHPMRTGEGPYLVDSWLFVAASNLVWILEMGLPALLVYARTRWLATAAAIALVAGIQLAAREFGFALLFVNLLLVFTARGSERALPVSALFYAWALAAAAGLLPEGALERSWL